MTLRIEKLRRDHRIDFFEWNPIVLSRSIISIIAIFTTAGCNFLERGVKFQLCSNLGRMFDITIYKDGRARQGDFVHSLARCSPHADCIVSPFPFMTPRHWPEVRTDRWQQGRVTFQTRRLSENSLELTSVDETSRYALVYHVGRGVQELVVSELHAENGSETGRLVTCAGSLTFEDLPALLSAAEDNHNNLTRAP